MYARVYRDGSGLLVCVRNVCVVEYSSMWFHGLFLDACFHLDSLEVVYFFPSPDRIN